MPAWLSRLLGRRSLVVPEKYNRNSSTVTALMPPEQSGRWLLERMRGEIGLASYAGVSMLDFGCGVRFSQAILNTGLDIGTYTGVDNYREMIEFLQANVRDPRLSYVFLDAYHPLYNRTGRPLSRDARLPLDAKYDVVSMFSVITHQNPADSEAIFTLLRRYVSSTGHLFFTCFLDAEIASYEDRSPEQNGGRCVYNPSFLRSLVESCGWREVKSAPAEAPLIGDSFVLAPSAARVESR